MTPIEDMLSAFEMHYGGLRYSQGQRRELLTKYHWLRPGYKVAVYDEVIASHPASLRSLPDVALIEKAMNALGRPEAFEPAPLQIEDRTEEVHGSIRDMVNAKAKQEGELNHTERNRVRARVAAGNATPAEVFWIRCIDEYGGDWRTAVRKA